MTFEVVRILAILAEVAMESSLSDFNVIIYDKYLDHIVEQKWSKIPDCFNCKVDSFSFDFELKRIYIKSEVLKHE